MAWFNDWTTGTQIGDRKITRVFHKNDNFIIYEVNNSGWFVFDSVGDIGKQFSAIQTEWTDTTNLLNSPREKSRYVGKLSGALKECLMGNISAAKEKLLSVKASIIDYKTTIGRGQYLVGAFFTTILFTLLLLSIFAFDGRHIVILKIIFFGMMGGMLSVSLNIKSVLININSGDVFAHIVLGSTRILISAISSFIVYIMIKGGFFLGVIKESNDSVFYALAIISGFSEAFIPNLLKKSESHRIKANN
jgi:hypothetical protein